MPTQIPREFYLERLARTIVMEDCPIQKTTGKIATLLKCFTCEKCADIEFLHAVLKSRLAHPDIISFRKAGIISEFDLDSVYSVSDALSCKKDVFLDKLEAVDYTSIRSELTTMMGTGSHEITESPLSFTEKSLVFTNKDIVLTGRLDCLRDGILIDKKNIIENPNQAAHVPKPSHIIQVHLYAALLSICESLLPKKGEIRYYIASRKYVNLPEKVMPKYMSPLEWTTNISYEGIEKAIDLEFIRPCKEISDGYRYAPPPLIAVQFDIDKLLTRQLFTKAVKKITDVKKRLKLFRNSADTKHVPVPTEKDCPGWVRGEANGIIYCQWMRHSYCNGIQTTTL